MLPHLSAVAKNYPDTKLAGIYMNILIKRNESLRQQFFIFRKEKHLREKTAFMGTSEESPAVLKKHLSLASSLCVMCHTRWEMSGGDSRGWGGGGRGGGVGRWEGGVSNQKSRGESCADLQPQNPEGNLAK